MSFLSFLIACAVAFGAGRYAAGWWLGKGKPLAACLNLGSAVFALTFAASFLALPTRWSWPERAPTQAFTDTLKIAEHGDAKAEYGVGLMYSLGEEVATDKAQAVRWTRKSAEQGYAEAQVALGNMYLNGDYQSAGIPHDYRQGKEWIRKAAAQGHAWATMLLYNMEYEEKKKSLQ